MSMRSNSFVRLMGAAVLAAMASAAHAAAGWHALSPGIISNEDASQFYAADPEARVVRVFTASGASTVLGTARGYPLALVDDGLLVLGVPTQKGDAQLLLLDAGSGMVRARVAVALPPEVSANPLPAPNQRFEARATQDAAELRIDWTFEQRALRGAVVLGNEGNGSVEDADLIQRNGAFAVTVSDAAMAVRFVRADEATSPAPSVDLSTDERLAGVDGPQFRAANDESVLTSSALPDAALGTVYRWTLRSRADGKTQGELTVPYSMAPFVVAGEMVVYRIGPVMRLRADGTREENGSLLIGFDLADGRQRWSQRVAEREWFGPMPP